MAKKTRGDGTVSLYSKPWQVLGGTWERAEILQRPFSHLLHQYCTTRLVSVCEGLAIWKCCLGKWASRIKVNYETAPASYVSGTHDRFKSSFSPNSGAFAAPYLLAHRCGDPRLWFLSAEYFFFLPFPHLASFFFLKNPSLVCLVQHVCCEISSLGSGNSGSKNIRVLPRKGCLQLEK